MNTNLNPAELRRWAAQCDARARDPMITGAEYERLTAMRDGLLSVAQNQEWLEGIAFKQAG